MTCSPIPEFPPITNTFFESSVIVLRSTPTLLAQILFAELGVRLLEWYLIRRISSEAERAMGGRESAHLKKSVVAIILNDVRLTFMDFVCGFQWGTLAVANVSPPFQISVEKRSQP